MVSFERREIRCWFKEIELRFLTSSVDSTVYRNIQIIVESLEKVSHVYFNNYYFVISTGSIFHYRYIRRFTMNFSFNGDFLLYPMLYYKYSNYLQKQYEYFIRIIVANYEL